jgi:hypothetical protein
MFSKQAFVVAVLYVAFAMPGFSAVTIGPGTVTFEENMTGDSLPLFLSTEIVGANAPAPPGEAFIVWKYIRNLTRFSWYDYHVTLCKRRLGRRLLGRRWISATIRLSALLPRQMEFPSIK